MSVSFVGWFEVSAEVVPTASATRSFGA